MIINNIDEKREGDEFKTNEVVENLEIIETAGLAANDDIEPRIAAVC